MRLHRKGRDLNSQRLSDLKVQTMGENGRWLDWKLDIKGTVEDDQFKKSI